MRTWFAERIGTPSDAQARAWPEIAAGRHVLVTAPTGSGKTLTAFLWAIDRLLTGAWVPGRLRVLYVSPAKALNADIQVNLEQPLAELAARFTAAGVAAPPLRTAVRSGDTPTAERQRLVRHPPEILITTPESLNILLTSKGGRSLFGELETVILDEIHAVAGSKRGVHLATAVERLVRLAGEVQRIALSATVTPLERVAALVGGYRLEGDPVAPAYQPREVALVRSAATKTYEVRVSAAPPGGAGPAPEASAWDRLVPELAGAIRTHRSTLLFANSRRVTEKLTRLLNEGAASELAYSHHGALSKEVRAVVEGRLKRGELPALVATSSLELGIDIGDLDLVVLVQTPKSIASAIQRVGRAGHRVGEVSRGVFYPLHDRDLVSAAVVARALLEQDLEEIAPVDDPLDVLAQVILSMVVAEDWQLDELYAFLRASQPFHSLSRRAFDLTVEMLAGRYSASRLRELAPRIAIDRLTGRASARPGSAQLIYLSGGTIPDRGYFHLRLAENQARLGELDEEFVWERSIGDTFTLGAQAWRVVQITHNDVFVVAARGSGAMAPFWRADELDRRWHLSARIGRFLEWADGQLRSPSFPAALAERYHLDPQAIRELVELLEAQRSATGASLPHRHHLVAERVAGAGPGDGRVPVILHTGWGGTLNRPLGLALAALWEHENPTLPLEVVHTDDCLQLMLPEDASATELLLRLPPDELERLLRGRLENTGFFGSRFREAAGRALLLPRAGLAHRTPLWLNRQRAKRLLEAVKGHGDFPVLLETWRTCLEDEMELSELRQRLEELAAGKIRVSEVTTTKASPFAAALVWKQTNIAMYDDDTPLSGGGGVRQDLFQELLRSSQLRPRLAASLVAELEAKLQRVARGYAPREGRELVEWVKERLLLPEGEWQALLAAFERDARGEATLPEAAPELERRLLRLTLPASSEPALAALETLPRLCRCLALSRGDLDLRTLSGAPLGAEAEAALESLFAAEAQAGGEVAAEGLPALLAEWSRFYGPFPAERPRSLFGLAAETLAEVAESLEEAGTWVIDQLVAGREGVEICDAGNLETLLRWTRAAARPAFQALPLAKLPLFLASFQGLTAPGSTVDELKRRLEQLLGYPAPAGLWEREILPARLVPYYPAWLDSLMAESDLLWLGVGPERLCFAFPADLELLLAAEPSAPARDDLFPEAERGYELAELARRTGRPSAELAQQLWQLAWEGRAANDSFATLRRGILQRFRPAAEPEPKPLATARTGRFRFDRWAASRPLSGRWFPLARPEPPPDALEAEELAKERVRLLLGRYGVLFRELLARELPALAWGPLFRALRRMELAGEVLAGYFFEGIPGPQFASPGAFRRLQEGLAEDPVYWLGALDPASPCGLDLAEWRGAFPRRVPSNHLVFEGSRQVVVSRRGGAELELAPGPDHPQLREYLGFLRVLLTREFDPEKALTVEKINGEPAGQSPYLAALRELFGATREPQGVRLFKRW